MRGVFRQLYYHVVWSTRGREPALAAHLRPVLKSSIEEKCRLLGCTLHAVDAVEDHVHVALEIPPALAVGEVVGQLKGTSSKALNQACAGSGYWQRGYGIVSFRKTDLPRVCEYIASQEQRHRDGELSPSLETCGEGEE